MPKVQGPSGRLVDTVIIDFEADAEPWSTFTLSDGTVIKFRTTPQSIIRLEGEFDSAGYPAYIINWSTQVRIVKSKIRGEPTIGTTPQQTKQPGRDPSVG